MANGRRDWWNQGQKMPTQRMRTTDVLGGVSEWASQMINLSEKGKKNKRQHFLSMADAITRGFESEYDNDTINTMISKLEQFHVNRGDKYDLETQDMYKVYMDKLKGQQNENIDFKIGQEKWANDSIEAETFISDMYAYSQKKAKGEALDFIKDDTLYNEAVNSGEISSYAKSVDAQEQYEKWQEEKMKNIMVGFSGHIEDFGTRFYDRLPPSISESMGNTRLYMQDILRGWKEDGVIDDEEFSLSSTMIKDGNPTPLYEMRKRREILDMNVNIRI